MKKIIVVFLLILTSCGYQPLYKTDQNIKSLNISEVIFSGDKKINNVIYQKLPIVLVKNDESLNKLSLESKKDW